MGKDLEGNKLGKGISQRKDGFYVARLTDYFGRRKQKVFKSYRECAQWLEDEEFKKNGGTYLTDRCTVNEWYAEWMEYKKRTVRLSTVKHYERVYRNHIKPMIGHMVMKDVTTRNCQLILNRLADDGRKSSSIHSCRAVLHDLLEYAVELEIIDKNPCTKFVKSNIGTPSIPREALTREEQRTFIRAIEGHFFELAWLFILQTGLRVSELNGLQWSDIDGDILHVQRILWWNNDEWVEGNTKSEAGKRDIPLTKEATRILDEVRCQQKSIKVADFRWSNHVFLNKKGKPQSAQNYDYALRSVCRSAGLREFSMHILRHTFATRCIESGIQPKTLQSIMGHSSIRVTMDLYVHSTTEQKSLEMKKIEDCLVV